MSKALEELRARLLDLEADLAFVSLASRLRPRLSDALDWNTTGDALQLARDFMNAKNARIEGLLGPLLVRLLAALERYTRKLVEESVELYASRFTNYDQLAQAIKTRNIVLTGTLLKFSESPREHLNLHLETLIANLASCQAGSTSYRLNPQAFGADVVGVGPLAIERALRNVGMKDWWDKLGAEPDLARTLGSKGARATGERAQARLEELWRWRNHLAHGGDDEVALTETQLRECLAFVEVFSTALDKVAANSFPAKVARGK